MAAETKPASRRERKKERTRQEIYAAAMKLFADRSYHRVTVEEICGEADVARTTFFAHFPSKSALLLEYSRGVATRFRESHWNSEATATEQLRALATLVMESAILSTVRSDVLNLECGAFSERWHTISKLVGRQADRVSVPWGEAIDPERHRLDVEVKAATAHGLRIARAIAGEDGKWEASVTLDV